MSDIEKDIEELKTESSRLAEELQSISDDIYRGNKHMLPLQSVTNILRDLKRSCDKHTDLINKINQESIKARNQVVYMFLALLTTVLSKIVVQYITGN